MATSTSITVRAIDQASAPLRNIRKSLQNLTDPVGLRSLSRGLNDVKRSAISTAKVTGGLAVAGAVGIAGILSPSVALQRSLNNVRKRLDDVAATDSDFVKLEGVIKNIGRTTELTANQAAQGAQFMAQAGLSASQINKSLEHVVDLQIGAGDNAQLKETADIMTDIGSVFFGKDLANHMEELADVMARTTSSTNTDLIQLGEAFKYGAQFANQAGQTLQSTAALAGQLANVGLKGSVAGTGIKRFFLALSQEKNEGTFANLGVDVFDNLGNFKEAGDIISDLQKAMAKFSQKQKSVALQDIFGTIGFTAAASLLDASDSLKNLKTELDNSTGAAKKMREITESDPLGAFKSSLSALEGLLIAVGQKFHEPLKKIAKHLTAVINKITEWVNQNPKIVKIIGIVTAIGVAVLGLTAVLAGVVAAFAGIAAVIIKVGAVAGALALKLAVVGAAFSVFTTAYTFLTKLKQAFIDLNSPLERLAYLWMKITGAKKVFGFSQEKIDDKIEKGEQRRLRTSNAEQEGLKDYKNEQDNFAQVARDRQAAIQLNQNVNVNNAPIGTRVEKGEGDNIEITIPTGADLNFISA